MNKQTIPIPAIAARKTAILVVHFIPNMHITLYHLHSSHDLVSVEYIVLLPEIDALLPF